MEYQCVRARTDARTTRTGPKIKGTYVAQLSLKNDAKVKSDPVTIKVK